MVFACALRGGPVTIAAPVLVQMIVPKTVVAFTILATVHIAYVKTVTKAQTVLFLRAPTNAVVTVLACKFLREMVTRRYHCVNAKVAGEALTVHKSVAQHAFMDDALEPRASVKMDTSKLTAQNVHASLTAA
jgi:RNase adaptor protein for sRNA GlmZ degradation